MSTTHQIRNVPVSNNLHPAIYATMAGTVLWITLAVWAFFGHSPYTALQIAVVAVFAIAFVATPVAIWRLSGKRPGAKREANGTLGAWADGEMDTITGKMHGSHAAVMVLLAPVACALGITGVSMIAWLVGVGAL